MAGSDWDRVDKVLAFLSIGGGGGVEQVAAAVMKEIKREEERMQNNDGPVRRLKAERPWDS